MPVQKAPTLLGIASRLFWMMIGPLILAITAYSIVTTGNGWLTTADIIFLAVLAGLVVARWLEFQAGSPQTADGEPAGPEHLRRYSVVVIIAGLVLWIAINVVANHVLGINVP